MNKLYLCLNKIACKASVTGLAYGPSIQSPATRLTRWRRNSHATDAAGYQDELTLHLPNSHLSNGLDHWAGTSKKCELFQKLSQLLFISIAYFI